MMDERERLVGEYLDLNRDLGRRIHRGMPREWLETEITMPQLKTLMVLYGMGQATMGELADALGTGVSTVTGIVDRLVDHGLVVREEDPRDRRVVVGHPTGEGLALIDRLLTATRDSLGRVLGQLSLDELHLCVKAQQLISDAASRVCPDSAVSTADARSR